MTIGKIEKVLNKWQWFAVLGLDVNRLDSWRWEIWCFSLLEMPVYGSVLQKYYRGRKMYRGFIMGNSYKIPRFIRRYMER